MITEIKPTMTGIELSNRHWNAAQERVNTSPVYKNSHRKEQANEVGFLGEVVIEEWMRCNNLSYSDKRHSTELD